MTEQADHISFGTYLKKIRMEKEVRLEEISAITKISMHVLSHIEKEDHDQLPSPSVVRGFLRLYSDCIGADQNMIVNLYTESLEARSLVPSGKGRMGKHLNAWIRFFLFLGALTLLVAGSVYYSSESTETEQAVTSADQSEKIADERVQEAEAEIAETTAALPAAEEIQPKKHKLLVEAVDETWIKLIIDGKKPDEYTLAPGDRLELEALTTFNILIGNSAGVKLTLDEKPIRISGKKGQVVTLNLP